MGPLLQPQKFSRPELFVSFAISVVYPVLLWFRQHLLTPSGPGLGAMPNHIQDPSHEGGHLYVHVGRLGIPTPEAREGDEAIGLISAYQGSSRVCLGVEAKVRSGVSCWASLSLKELICVDLIWTFSTSKPFYVPWILPGAWARTMAPQCS